MKGSLEPENIKEDSEKEVQLVLQPAQYRRYRELLGKRVTVTGKLFHSHTGHHHKRLLLTTSRVRAWSSAFRRLG